MLTRKHLSKLSASLALAAFSAFAALPASAGDFPAGTYTAQGFTITFDGKGHFRVSEKGTLGVEGDYMVKDDQLKITDKSGPYSCTKAGQQSGTYRWKYDGNMLAFAKIGDSCKDRADTLTPQPWKKLG